MGWGFVVLRDGNVLRAGYGGMPSGTNNTAEITGAIRGIEAWAKLKVDLDGPAEHVTLVSDSQLTLGFATGQYSPSKNVELAMELNRLYSLYCHTIRWVRGHVGILANERCDRLAKKGRAEAALLLKHE